MGKKLHIGRALGGLVGRSTHHPEERAARSERGLRAEDDARKARKAEADVIAAAKAVVDAAELALAEQQEATRIAEIQVGEQQALVEKTRTQLIEQQEATRAAETHARVQQELAAQTERQLIAQQAIVSRQERIAEFREIGRDLAPAAVAECLRRWSFDDAVAFINDHNSQQLRLMDFGFAELALEERGAVVDGAIARSTEIIVELLSTGRMVDAACTLSQSISWCGANRDRLLAGVLLSLDSQLLATNHSLDQNPCASPPPVEPELEPESESASESNRNIHLLIFSQARTPTPPPVSMPTLTPEEEGWVELAPQNQMRNA